MRKALPAASTLLLGLAVAASGAPALAAEAGDTASLSVLHGVPDLPVDVYVNGELTLDDFQPGELAGPLDVPAGTQELAITAADAADDSEPVLGPIPVDLEAGGDYTAVAHLDAEGQPTATPFMNDTSQLEAGEGRLTVRHIAAAPAVDVWGNGEVVVPGLENPNEESLTLPAGTVEAAISLAGETDPVLGPAPVDVAEGTNTIVYAWGSAEDGNLALATQTVEAMHSAPDGVPTGNTPAAGEQGGLWAMLGAGALALTAAGAALVYRQRAGARA